MLLKILFLLYFAFSTLTGPAFAQWPKSVRWNIQNSWNESFELEYQQFIHSIGIARKNGLCKTTDECLRSSAANPMYAAKNPRRLKNIFSDCADFPYILRAYFSWMNDLPFAYTTDLVEANSFSDQKSDIRYSRFGNIITQKRRVYNGDNINNVLQNLSDTISSATFRTDASKSDSSSLFRDSYPVDINRKAIVPGTMVYDPNGHVAVVYDITPNGKILLIDAHPDNSVSAITYGEKFSRSRVQIGGGFSNFRPITLVNDEVFPTKNAELKTYSLIQFQKGPFIFNGIKMTFYEFVRASMADGVIIYKPLNEFNDTLNELCQDLKYREDAVNIAIKTGIQNNLHPYTLPENIYGADGEWEAYATPARDARLKASFREIKAFLQKVISSYHFKIPNLDYKGRDLIKDLREIYLARSKACTINVTDRTSIDLDFVHLNLFAISFDPYHCAALRWGITNVSSCGLDRNKISWYLAEQGLRNRIDRDNTIRTDYDVATLPNAPVSKVEMPDIRFDKLLEIIR